MTYLWLSGNKDTLIGTFDSIKLFEKVPINRRLVDAGYHEGSLSFWNQLVKLLLVDAKPNSADLSRTGPGTAIEAPLNAFIHLPSNSTFRPNLIEIPQQDFGDLKRAHDIFVLKLPELAWQLPYTAGSKGVVFTASTASLPALVVSLRMLRRTGSHLPVEIFLSSRVEYESICAEVPPKLNARCMFLSDILEGADLVVESDVRYLKAFAILFTDFEDVVLLDGDTIVLEDPEQLLLSEPFLSRGLVTWSRGLILCENPFLLVTDLV